MEKGTEILLNYGIAGVMLMACLAGIFWGIKWFVKVHLPKIQEDRAKETAALIAQSKELQNSITQQLERLIVQQESAAKMQAENEGKIVAGLSSLRSSVTKGFSDLNERLAKVENRVQNLENVNPK